MLITVSGPAAYAFGSSCDELDGRLCLLCYLQYIAWLAKYITFHVSHAWFNIVVVLLFVALSR